MQTMRREKWETQQPIPYQENEGSLPEAFDTKDAKEEVYIPYGAKGEGLDDDILHLTVKAKEDENQVAPPAAGDILDVAVKS